MTVTEQELYERVTDRIAFYRLGHYHSHTARRDEAGWPDLVVWGPGGLLFRELKSAEGRQSRAQVRVMRSLRAAGANFAIWRPAEWEAGVVDHELRLIATS